MACRPCQEIISHDGCGMICLFCLPWFNIRFYLTEKEKKNTLTKHGLRSSSNKGSSSLKLSQGKVISQWFKCYVCALCVNSIKTRAAV